MKHNPLFTVCIPAYNRSQYLTPLLNSIFDQSEQDFEVLLCEDFSTEREIIASIVKKYVEKHPGQIRYLENERNLGYDGNLRELIKNSNGEYCLFMGNDDLMCPDALKNVAGAIRRNPNCGVVVRSYATFETNPSVYKQVFRYYPVELCLPPGKEAIFAAYRRSVVIPGMVIKREVALSFSTCRFDGTLLYQLYLVGMVLSKHSAVFVPQIIALRRDGVLPDFGNSIAEKGKFTPKQQTTESSIHFVNGMLKIAKYIEETTKLKVYSNILLDIGNYSYPILSIQANRKFFVFLNYGRELARLGFWKNPFFYVYFFTLIILGPDRSDCIIKFIKSKLGYTPKIGWVK